MDLDAVRARWDAEADTYDERPDRGLRPGPVRVAWADVLRTVLPPLPTRIVDLGCGTGSLAVLVAELGYDVVGMDISSRMLERARAQARESDVDVTFLEGDANDPPLDPATFDVVLGRDVVATLPDPGAALATWARVVRPGGRLVLIETRTGTDGLAAVQLQRILHPLASSMIVVPLQSADLWGEPVIDERFAVVAHVRS